MRGTEHVSLTTDQQKLPLKSFSHRDHSDERSFHEREATAVAADHDVQIKGKTAGASSAVYLVSCELCAAF